MRKVTFPTFLTFVAFGTIVFTGTSFYYRTEYIPKGDITIIPDEYITDDAAPPTIEAPTVILKDPTIEQKFVGSESGVLESKDEQKAQLKKTDGPGYNRDRKKTEPVVDTKPPAIRDNWAKAGQPYVVPQMSESERSIKIKRFLPPKSGANNGN
ncbi:hypothetical protein FIP36_17015 [Salmonella enterica]|nr:hypothetical protein [Salmonella enterica]